MTIEPFWVQVNETTLRQGDYLPRVNQMLWLRFTSCLPHEVALVRAIWVISWGICLSILGLIWALANVLLLDTV